MLPEDLITPKEAARLVRCCLSTIHRWIHSGQLVAYKRGTSRYLVSRRAVEAQLREVVPPPEVATLTEEQRRAEEAAERLRKKGIGG